MHGSIKVPPAMQTNSKLPLITEITSNHVHTESYKMPDFKHHMRIAYICIYICQRWARLTWCLRIDTRLEFWNSAVSTLVLGPMNNSTQWYKTKWRRQRIIRSNPRINDANSYSKVQKSTFFHKSLVLKRLRVSPGSRSFLARPLRLPLHMPTVIILEPIKSCPVALPSPKGFGRDLTRPLAQPPVGSPGYCC